MAQEQTDPAGGPTAPCGCSVERLCPQHWQALDRAQRKAQQQRKPATDPRSM